MRTDIGGFSGYQSDPQGMGLGQAPPPRQSWLSSLIAAARPRIINISTLSWPLRLAVATTVSGALIAAFLIMFRDTAQPQVGILVTNTGAPTTHLPTSAFIGATVLWLIGWTFALTGAIHGHWAMRLAVFAVCAYMVSQVYIDNVITLVYLWPLGVIALWAVAISILRWRAARARRSPWRRLPVVTFVVVAALLVVHLASLYFAIHLGNASSTLFADALGSQLIALSFALLPVLFLSASDLTEGADAATGQLTALLGRLRSPLALGLLTAVIALAELIYQLNARGDFSPLDLISTYDMLEVVLVALVCLLLLVGVARLGRLRAWTVRKIPGWALALAAILTMASLAGPSVLAELIQTVHPTPASAVASYSVYRHSADNLPFSMAYPSEWQSRAYEPTKPGDLLAVDFFGVSGAHTSELALFAVPPSLREATDEQSASDVVGALCNCTPTIAVAPPHEAWQSRTTRTVEASTPNGKPVAQSGFVWWQTHGGDLYVVYAHTDPDGIASLTSVFMTMLDSWRPDLTATAPVASTGKSAFENALLDWDPGGVLSLGLIPLLLGLLLGAPLLLRGRERARGAGLFLLLYGLSEALLLLPQLLAKAGVGAPNIRLWSPAAHPVYFTAYPGLSQSMLQMVLALVTLGYLVVLALRRDRDGRLMRTLVVLLALNLGVLLISWLRTLFDTTSRLDMRFTSVQAVLLLCAFLWDLITSGEQTTNVDGGRTPRYARLLLYLGYSTLNVTIVLFISALAASGSIFDTSAWTAIGLRALGVPLLISLALLRLTQPGARPVAAAQAPAGQWQPQQPYPYPVPAMAPQPMPVYGPPQPYPPQPSYFPPAYAPPPYAPPSYGPQAYPPAGNPPTHGAPIPPRPSLPSDLRPQGDG